jgi:hypothetical protein
MINVFNVKNIVENNLSSEFLTPSIKKTCFKIKKNINKLLMILMIISITLI